MSHDPNFGTGPGDGHDPHARAAADEAAEREALRADLPDAHFGLAAAIILSALVGAFVAPLYGLLVAGAFAAIFLVVLGAQCLAGFTWESVRRAYLVTFVWGRWL
ncbi:hypothetical protein [Streptomyces sp. cg36]|uniref:hypothetical protein n=1 Tax=Streptomyces sp. cg36 TaxID=3238798 RepID=UPI0034E2E9DF